MARDCKLRVGNAWPCCRCYRRLPVTLPGCLRRSPRRRRPDRIDHAADSTIRRCARRAKMLLPGAVALAASQRSELALADPKHVGWAASSQIGVGRSNGSGFAVDGGGGELAGKSLRITCFI